MISGFISILKWDRYSEQRIMRKTIIHCQCDWSSVFFSKNDRKIVRCSRSDIRFWGNTHFDSALHIRKTTNHAIRFAIKTRSTHSYRSWCQKSIFRLPPHSQFFRSIITYLHSVFPCHISMFQAFRREIERRIEVIPKIVYEPKLLPDDDSKYILPPTENSIYPSSFYCRQRAVDDVKKLGNFIFHFSSIEI